MLPGLALVLALAPAPLAPTVSADFDGDGVEETVSASPARGAVRLEIRGASGGKLAAAKAPAPAADVVHVQLTAGALGSPGALVAVDASTDAGQCMSVWRFKDRALTRLPIRDAGGRELPDCGRPGEWNWTWRQAAEGRPAELVRERTEKVARGELVVREAFAFAGFSLEADPKGSGSELNGVPIPSWYRAVFYARPALEILYGRFGLARMREHPSFVIDADRERGGFALRFDGPGGELTAPIDSSESLPGTTILGARADGKAVRATVHLGGDGSVPYEIEIAGLGAPYDQIYTPAGGWKGDSRKVFPTAADEAAAQDLAGAWLDPAGRSTFLETEGVPPFRVRLEKDLYTLDMANAAPPWDILLVPVEPSGRAWGIVLRGPNTLDRVPLTCAGPGAAGCRADGPGEKLRRLGARMNVH